MTNYYTYGAIPKAEETVFGPLQAFAKGGQAASIGERNPVTPMLSRKPESVSTGSRVVPPEGYPPGTVGSTYAPGATLPEGVDPMAPIGATDPEQTAKMMAMLSLLPAGTFGNMGSVADPNIAATARTVADTRPAGGLQGQQFEEGYLEAQKEGPLLGIWQPGLESALEEDPGLQARVEEMETERAERIAGLEQSIPQLKPLSDLLKAGQFKEAFEYAKANDLTDQLMKTENLKNLRGPFSKEEMSAFFNAIPSDVAKEYTGEGWIFDPSAGVEGSLDPLGTGGEGTMSEGFPDPNRAFSRKDSGLIKKVVDVGMQAALAAAGLPPLTAMAAAGVTKAATTGGDVEAALKAAALAGVGSYVGGKVGEALDAAAKSGTEAAANQAVANAAKAAGGLDDLAEVVVTATRSSLPGGLAAAGTSLAGQEALRQGATPKDLEEVVVQSPPELEEIVVQSLRKAPPRDLQNLFASLGTAGTQDILSERDIAELQEAEQRMVEEQAAEQQPTPEEDSFQTVLVSGSRLPQLNVAEVVPGLAAQLAQAGYRSPLIEGQPPPPETLDAMEEIVVHGQKPTIPVDLAKIGLGGLTAAQIAQGFTQPNVDPTTGELREPLESQQELDKIQEALASGSTIPGTESMWDKISGAVDKLSTLQKLAGLVGAFGAGQATAPKGTGIGVGAPTGGALPKYEFGRVQTRPDIDYFTYGTRPEVMFFEDTMSKAAPVTEGPDAGQAPPDESGPFAKGGLAEGGRYYEGAGSGRDDKIPALLSDGEYVIDAETLALLGDGSPKEGARRMDQFRAKIRKHKGSALSRGRISPNAKSPDKYMGGGLA